MLERFLNECDVVAVLGNLTVSFWEKLGRDLNFAAEQGMLKKGVRPVWKLVRGCSEEQRCSEAVENGQATLEILQEERSEKAASEKAMSDTGPDKGIKERKPTTTRLSPSLSYMEELKPLYDILIGDAALDSPRWLTDEARQVLSAIEDRLAKAFLKHIKSA